MPSTMKKAPEYDYSEASVLTHGRCERIRTFDPLHPMQVRYQAAPHTESDGNYNATQCGSESRSRICDSSLRKVCTSSPLLCKDNGG